MAKDPAFLFYSSDFLSGVQDLTMEERGQYITLLCLQHQKGRLSKKIISLAVANAAADVMAKFRQDENGLWYNERLELEAEKRREHTDKQRQRALDGWEKRKNQNSNGKRSHTTANAAALPLEDENENINDTINNTINKGVDFEIFWNLYDKKVGLKEKVEKKWKALKVKEQEAAIAYIPSYKIAQPDKKFRKDPSTFLNNKSWLDELIIPVQQISKFEKLANAHHTIKNPYESANSQDITID